MAAKSRRRMMLEQSLSEDPSDAFLRYGLGFSACGMGMSPRVAIGSRH